MSEKLIKPLCNRRSMGTFSGIKFRFRAPIYPAGRFRSCSGLCEAYADQAHMAIAAEAMPLAACSNEGPVPYLFPPATAYMIRKFGVVRSTSCRWAEPYSSNCRGGRSALLSLLASHIILHTLIIIIIIIISPAVGNWQGGLCGVRLRGDSSVCMMPLKPLSQSRQI
jgi:hypothetical protein